MWNISNAIGGYMKPVPGISYLMSVSVGPVRSETAYNNEFAFTYGLLNNIRLGCLVDLNLEVKQMVVTSVSTASFAAARAKE